MNTIIGLIIGITILLFILNPAQKELGVFKIKLPAWAKLNPAQIWGIAFLDRNVWIKKILIFLFQSLIGFALFIMAIFRFSFSKAKKMVFK